MVFKKKLPLAVVISMGTMLLLHMFMPINLQGEGGGEKATGKERSAAVSNFHPLEACPEDGELLAEDSPFWTQKIEEYKKPKYELDFVGEKPLMSACCSPDNATKKSYGYVMPPEYSDKCKNPCWYDGKRLRCLPFFYIIGASKSATQDLFSRLLVHPEIKSVRKGIHWFNRLRTLGANLKWYTNQFNPIAKEINSQIKAGETANTIIGESDTEFLSDVHVWHHLTGNQGCLEPRITIANHIRYLNPNARIIISLRDPVYRVYSTYLYTAAAREKLKDPSTQKLHEMVLRAVTAYKECFKKLPARVCVYNRTLSKLHPIDVISGAYAPFVEDWLRVFPRKQVHVIKFEDYSQDMATHTKEVVDFLGLPGYSSSDFDAVQNMGKFVQNVYYKMGPIQNRTIKLLKDLYTPFNIRLSKMLQDDRFLWK